MISIVNLSRGRTVLRDVVFIAKPTGKLMSCACEQSIGRGNCGKGKTEIAERERRLTSTRRES